MNFLEKLKNLEGDEEGEKSDEINKTPSMDIDDKEAAVVTEGNKNEIILEKNNDDKEKIDEEKSVEGNKEEEATTSMEISSNDTSKDGNAKMFFKKLN